METSIRELLTECKLQLEYLNEKFGETGTTNSVLSKIKAAIKEDDEPYVNVCRCTDAMRYNRIQCPKCSDM